MTNAIQDPDRIPADPLLVEAAKRAAELQEKEYARALRRMNRIAPMIREHMPGYHPDMREHGKPTMLLWMTHPRTKERTLYVDPEIMKIAQGVFRKMRSEVVSDLEHAPSITHQGAALTESVNDSFSGVIEHGDFMQVHRAMLRFHEIMRQEYGKLVAERKSKLDHPEVTDVMARSQTAILDLMEKIQAFGAMSQEATITLEGLVQAWQREHTPDEPLQNTPYDLAVLRYSRTAEGKAKPMEEYDEADFERINKFCTNIIHDLMSQYAHGFNEENSLAMSWFVGKGFESLKQKQPARRHLKEPGSAPVEVTLKADNDEDGTPLPAEKILLTQQLCSRYETPMDSVEPAAANENHPSTVTMMQDPKMRAEVSERVGKVLKKYPRAHSNVYDLVTAANEFIDTYKLDTGDKTPGKP